MTVYIGEDIPENQILITDRDVFFGASAFEFYRHLGLYLTGQAPYDTEGNRQQFRDVMHATAQPEPVPYVDWRKWFNQPPQSSSHQSAPTE